MEEAIKNILYVLLGLFIVGGGFILIMSRKDDVKSRRDMWFLYQCQFAIITVIILPSYCGGVFLVTTVALLVILCSNEFYATLRKCGYLPYDKVGIAMGVVLLVFSYLAWIDLTIMAALLFVLAICTYTVLFHSKNEFIARYFSTLFGILYPSVFLCYFALVASSSQGFLYTIFLYLLVEINDVCAHLVGKYCGRKKIFPRISPNKTYIGCFAGVLGTICLAQILSFAVYEFSRLELLVVGVSVAVLGQLGDITASIFKRAADVKDFSDKIPIHGGVLDIYDSLIFVSPFFYFYLKLFARL